MRNSVSGSAFPAAQLETAECEHPKAVANSLIESFVLSRYCETIEGVESDCVISHHWSQK
jgi:hypothetical protein